MTPMLGAQVDRGPWLSLVPKPSSEKSTGPSVYDSPTENTGRQTGYLTWDLFQEVDWHTCVTPIQKIQVDRLYILPGPCSKRWTGTSA